MDKKVIPSSSSDDSSDDSDQATTTATARARDEAQADSPHRDGYLEALLRRLRITEYRPVGLLEGLERRLQVQIVAQQVMHVCHVESAWDRNSIGNGQCKAQTMEDNLLRIMWIFVSSFGPMPWFRTCTQTSSAPQPIKQQSQPLPPAEKTPTVMTMDKQMDGFPVLDALSHNGVQAGGNPGQTRL
ncbi:hypothetical protein I7I51_05998 [Histoplasma capsulatum]|uniref:Uncharacterized protein n=1 Tax=Ajellomyces capsulatus TaxID=5037 RepID=A0A8A1MF77_AJECA|nr:predicted protein [Histoplasma mississippiense (nom. inval.)]EDN05623.1 predicted protein [Histoplasma mississippiense (nom. inval.)]QSS65156.1 hypothetical protein I7I51_05998 [Histoplasma capsulatum]